MNGHICKPPHHVNAVGFVGEGVILTAQPVLAIRFLPVFVVSGFGSL